jgi:uncharacterized protein YecT (DUF1311 family)
MLFSLVAALLLAQPELEAAGARPALECSQHVTDDRARRSCLRDLMRAAESDLAAAADSARSEARELDLDTGGMLDAADAFDDAQAAWIGYRDAECARRAARVMLGEAAREEISTDCRIALSRERAAELRAY